MAGLEKYRVGQVLFVIPEKKPGIVPILIIERRVSETIQGTMTTYVARQPKDGSAPFDLATVKGTIYNSLEEVKNVCLQKSQKTIEAMIKQAAETAQQKFKAPQVSQQQQQRPQQVELEPDPLDQGEPMRPMPPQSMMPDDGQVEIELPDGTITKVPLQR